MNRVVGGLLVRTPDGKVWPALSIYIVYGSNEREHVAVIEPNPPDGSSVFSTELHLVHGAYVEVERKICEVVV